MTIRHNKCGHEFNASYNNFSYNKFFVNNCRCPFCHTISNFQKEVYDFIKFLDNTAIYNDRKTLKKFKKEIDIYLPDKKIGFECDGLYWHSENLVGKKYQMEKSQICEKNNIRLIHIFEDEFIKNKNIVFNKIRHIIGKDNNSEKIYARKCKIEIISKKEKNDFLNNNHLQGTCSSSINLGLKYQNKLVAVLTFSKPRPGIGKSKTNKIRYELARYATDINYRIIGGFSKLLKYFTDNYNFDEIYSYGDLRWVNANNNVYLKNNFKLTQISPPNYWYFYNNTRYHRFGFTKKSIKRKFPDIYDSNLTEFQMMDKTEYKRIWDCGTAVFTYTKE